MSYTVLARRYRSTDFDEIVGQEPIARTLRNAVEAGRTAHAYLFCGTRGVGKTSMARILAKALNATADLGQRDEIAEAVLRGDDLDVIEIDGASNRGINEARDLIAGAGLSPARCPYKIYIIDEVHMLTREAFNALLKTMEEPPAHVKFILCTTEPGKVPATIQSRCQRFDFRPITTGAIAAHLRQILDSEQIAADDTVIRQVAGLGNGSMRDALSLLDRLLAAGDETLTTELLTDMLGLPDQAVISAVIDAVAAGDASAALIDAARLLDQGASVESALEMLAEHLRTLMVVRACGDDTDLLDLPAEAVQAAAVQAARFDVAGLVHMIAVCDAAARNARNSTIGRALFDAAVVRLAMAEHLADISTLLAGDGPAPGQKKKPAAPSPRVSPTAAPSPVAPDPSPPRPDRPARLTEVKGPEPGGERRPDPSGPAPAPEVADDEVWPRALEVAARSPSDQAKVEHLRLVTFDGRALTLSIDVAGAPMARYLAGQKSWLEGLVSRATGRRVSVTIDATTSRPAGPATPLDRGAVDAVRQLPEVRQAIDLFDATVTEVTDAPSPEAPARQHKETADMLEGLKGMGSLAGVLKELPRIKAKMEEVKKNLGNLTVEAETGGGAVRAVVSAEMRLVSLDVDHALLAGLVDLSNEEDRALAQDLIVGAVNAALAKGKEAAEQEIARAAGELGIPLPPGGIGGLLR